MLTLRESIGKRIVEMREEKHWSQLRLSTECGIDGSNLSRIEHGLENNCMETLEKIIAALGVSYLDFFSKME